MSRDLVENAVEVQDDFFGLDHGNIFLAWSSR